MRSNWWLSNKFDVHYVLSVSLSDSVSWLEDLKSVFIFCFFFLIIHIYLTGLAQTCFLSPHVVQTCQKIFGLLPEKRNIFRFITCQSGDSRLSLWKITHRVKWAEQNSCAVLFKMPVMISVSPEPWHRSWGISNTKKPLVEFARRIIAQM